MTRARSYDFRIIISQGHFVRPLTDRGRAWLCDHVRNRVWFGRNLHVPANDIIPLVLAIAKAGLTIAPLGTAAPEAIDARTEEQEAAIGQHLADALGLKKSRDEKGRYETAWGTKTPLGLYRTIKRVIEEGPLS